MSSLTKGGVLQMESFGLKKAPFSTLLQQGWWSSSVWQGWPYSLGMLYNCEEPI